MLRWIRRVGLAVAAFAVMVAVLGLGWRAWRQHETARALAINTPNGVEEACYVRIGGIEQWITIRGEDRANPVLLVLAGGPGNSLVPLAPVFRGWQQAFTVVQWDQRGAGRTYARNGVDEQPMTMARMRDDGIELAQWLLTHLDQPKLVIVGHSWGSMLGVLMVARRPDLFLAYVGTGQVVAKEEKEELLYRRLVDEVRAANDADGAARLAEIGPPPYATEDDLLVERAVSERYDTDAERNLEATLQPVVLFAPHFSLADIYAMLQGNRFAADALYRETLGYDAHALGRTFAVPFFVFNGDRDRVTPAELAASYVDWIDAPQKAFVALPGGGHSAMLTMPDAFLAELVARVLPLAKRDQSTRRLVKYSASSSSKRTSSRSCT